MNEYHKFLRVLKQRRNIAIHRDYNIDVLYYKPDTYLITNKPWDLRIDGDTTSCPTAESLLYSHFPQHEKLYLLHQLDYVTSGVHCWGLSKAAAGEAGKLFMSRDVKKTYSALVQGHVEQDNFVIDKPLVDDPSEDRKRVYVAEEEGKGKECQTHVEVVKRGYFHHVPVTHVKLSPVTGRRHQLRVHLQSVGHPIVGDYTYEQPLTEQAFRTMLHSWKLELPIPGQAPLRFEAPEPFAELI
ncbi:pseudouridine synthase, partial [Powellomyces hirtus]